MGRFAVVQGRRRTIVSIRDWRLSRHGQIDSQLLGHSQASQQQRLPRLRFLVAGRHVEIDGDLDLDGGSGQIVNGRLTLVLADPGSCRAICTEAVAEGGETRPRRAVGHRDACW